MSFLNPCLYGACFVIFWLKKFLLSQLVPRQWWSIQRCLILYSFWIGEESSRIKISVNLVSTFFIMPAVWIRTASKLHMGNTIFYPLENTTILSSQVIYNLHNVIDLHSCLNLFLAFCPSQQLNSCSKSLTQWIPQRFRNMCRICRTKLQGMRKRLTNSVVCLHMLHLPQRIVPLFCKLTQMRQE